ncbi:Gon7 family-domain-containing protein [Aspergillus caelatus]|uniref:EKC/KEOPS complex subunit GON7 n=1 Tax=Aspergillus caelatus TaxID=61420 RepID=A0A5N6ZSI6_9EURO|nr:Gon7 family-domain-containing protein [Aspergillus caelatus]KAE8360562.1 Gon7 family-domain-containing protein [Aspergillus caelatus]
MSATINSDDQHDSKRLKISSTNETFGNTDIMAAGTSSTQSNPLRAVYSAPQSTQTFEYSIASPLPSTDSSPENVPIKVAYLSELRKLVPNLQNDINVFLTERMEEDKKLAEAQGRQISEQERKEEENYGEEVVEEDA